MVRSSTITPSPNKGLVVRSGGPRHDPTGVRRSLWYLPDDVHERLVAAVTAWVDAQPDGRGTVEQLRPFLVVEAFRTPD
jgi:hypothetical protein